MIRNNDCETMQNCTQLSQTAVAVVTGITDKTAVIQINDRQRQSCAQCHNKGGCQSLSLYHLLFAKRPISITNQDYRIGQKVSIRFPKSLILQALGWLLGLPLAGFILGVLLAGKSHELMGFVLGVGIALVTMLGGSYIVRRRIRHSIAVYPD